jgi:hypothetical protein
MGVSVAFAAAFSMAAVASFGVVGLTAVITGVGRVDLPVRLAFAGFGLLVLALVDVRAMLMSTYCPIGWRRQTPRVLMRRYPPLAVATVWGLDTGMVVTTIRVAAVSWAALYLALLDFSPVWTGLAYGLGFIAPFYLLVFRPQLGRAARGENGADAGLEALLRMRPAMQGSSAVLLLASAGILLASWRAL